MRTFAIFIIFIFQLCILNQSAWADSSIEEEVKAMKEQMAQMQIKINTLEDRLARSSTPPAAVPVVANRSVSGKWTPEIGVVADTVLKLDSSKEDVDGNNRLSLRELELVLGSNVDPFSRLDATVSFSDSDDEPVALEEAYLTRFGLPFETTARIGKFKPKVGKVLGTHRDGLDTVDEPLVIQRYFGTEGMSKAGIDFTKMIDLPLPVTQQVIFGILEGGNGEGGTAFGTTRRAPTLYGRLKNYIDLGATTGLEAGISPMFGSAGDEPGFDSHVLGADVTLTQHLGPVQTIKWQSEVFHVDHRKTIDTDTDTTGFYSLLDYHFHPSWSVGVRYDDADDRGETGYLTFFQSEFARWRLQYSHTSLATGKEDNAVYLQGTFAIGDHKHKLQ